MKRFRKILVPIDFSPCSTEALRYAAEFSRRYEAALTLLHVHHTIDYPVADGFIYFAPEQLESFMGELRKELEITKKAALAEGALRVSTELRQGVPFNEILKLAREGEFDLVVMGTHGHSGLLHALIGSVAERVVRKAPCPVLTVRMPEA